MSERAKMIWAVLIVTILVVGPVGYWFLGPSTERESVSGITEPEPEVTYGSVPPWPDALDAYENRYAIRLHVPEGREAEANGKMRILFDHVQKICDKHGMKILCTATWAWWLKQQHSTYLFVALDRAEDAPTFPRVEWNSMFSVFGEENLNNRAEFYIARMGYSHRPKR